MWMLAGNLKCVILMHTDTQEQQQTIRLHTVDSLRLRCKHTERTHTLKSNGSGTMYADLKEVEKRQGNHPCACVSVHV